MSDSPAQARPGASRQVPLGDREAAARHRAERTAAAAEHARALAERQRQEADQARGLIAEFLERARVTGPAPAPLVATDPDGRRRYRTPLRGWYLRRDQRVGIDTDGQFYVLVQPGGLAALVTGIRPTPSDPPLVIGAGGRDGESVDLADALARVLAGG